MDPRQKNNREHERMNKTANVLPATEIVENPNPRANENLPRKDEMDRKGTNDDIEAGSEITDGEDA